MNGMGYGRIGSTKQTLEEAKLKNNVMYFHQQYRVVDNTQVAIMVYLHNACTRYSYAIIDLGNSTNVSFIE